MGQYYAGSNINASTKLHGVAFPVYATCRKIPRMGKRRIYLKEWRTHRKLTQSQVVDRLAVHEDDLLPKTTASLSRLENRKQQYSERVLEALADIYECEPDDLIGKDPSKDGVLIDFIRLLDAKKRQQAIAIIEALSKTDGTNG